MTDKRLFNMNSLCSETILLKQHEPASFFSGGIIELSRHYNTMLFDKLIESCTA